MTLLQNTEQPRDNAPKISVIVPVYNVARYLPSCLDSALSQTLQEIEIICVDDGSIDESPAILEEYRQRDSRIVVFHQPNRGVSAARNRGLDAARGRYLMFLDSDDLLYPQACETVYRLCSENQLEILLFAAETECIDIPVTEAREGLRRKLGAPYLSPGVVTGPELMIAAHQADSICVCMLLACDRAYVKAMGVRFFEGIVHEDELFLPLLACKAKRALSVGDKLYCYRLRPDSITTGRVSRKNVEGAFIAGARLLAESMSSPPEDLQCRRMLLQRARVLMNACWQKVDELPPEERADIMKDAREEYRYLFGITRTAHTEEELQEQLQEAETRIKGLEPYRQRMEDTERSMSFRAGMALTWLPRKLREWYRRCFG